MAAESPPEPSAGASELQAIQDENASTPVQSSSLLEISSCVPELPGEDDGAARPGMSMVETRSARRRSLDDSTSTPEPGKRLSDAFNQAHSGSSSPLNLQ